MKSYFVNKVGKEAITARDANCQHVENKLKKTMGPLGKLWEATDKARKGDITAIKAEELLRLVEKSALFLGQAAQSLTYYRRMDLLFQIMKKKEGRTKWMLNNWQQVTTDKEVLNIVSGYLIPLISTPPFNTAFSPVFSKTESVEISQVVTEMEKKGAVVKVSCIAYIFIFQLFIETLW